MERGRASAEEENAFIKKHDFSASTGISASTTKPQDTKAHFSFPYGDFRSVHRCAVISAESRAGQHKHPKIEEALKQLLAQIDDN